MCGHTKMMIAPMPAKNMSAYGPAKDEAMRYFGSIIRESVESTNHAGEPK